MLTPATRLGTDFAFAYPFVIHSNKSRRNKKKKTTGKYMQRERARENEAVQ
jgi:hypothetical protein